MTEPVATANFLLIETDVIFTKITNDNESMYRNDSFLQYEPGDLGISLLCRIAVPNINDWMNYIIFSIW